MPWSPCGLDKKNPQALQVAINAMQAFHFIGIPEGKLALAQAATYLAVAPKSNALYLAYGEAAGDVHDHGPIAGLKQG